MTEKEKNNEKLLLMLMKMRKLQIRFWNSKTMSAEEMILKKKLLIECKRAENEVDKLIEIMIAKYSEQCIPFVD